MARGLPTSDSEFAFNKGYTPEGELFRAIILRAVEDYHSGNEFAEDAYNYFMGQGEYADDPDFIFSFRTVCDYLGFDVEKTRYAIFNAKSKISTRRRAA